jgi:hypothetical protein
LRECLSVSTAKEMLSLTRVVRGGRMDAHGEKTGRVFFVGDETRADETRAC